MTGNNIIADTNIFIDLMKGDKSIAKKLQSFDTIYLSPIVLAEFYFGAYRSANPEKHLSKIGIVLKQCNLLKLDAETAEFFVKIKLALFIKGNPIPENDIWIAASALQYNLPVYTSDKHFAAINDIVIV